MNEHGYGIVDSRTTEEKYLFGITEIRHLFGDSSLSDYGEELVRKIIQSYAKASANEDELARSA